MSGFCRGRGVPLSSLKYWKKELAVREQKRQAKRAATEATRNALQFLPVRVLDPAVAALGSVEVVLRGGRILRVGNDFDPGVLQKLVATLEEAR
jgi:membrane protein required for beta-lactamase induction